MEARDLDLLRVLADTHNMTHAAKRLYMTQSALSKRIKQLEQELDVVLLYRSRNGVHFTPAGEALLAYEKTATAQMEQLHRELSFLRQHDGGIIRLGAVPVYALRRLPDVLFAYTKGAPKVRVQLVTGTNSELHQHMLDGTIDFAVTTGNCCWGGPQYFLQQESFFVVCARSNQEYELKDIPFFFWPMEEAQENIIRFWLHENGLICPKRSDAVDLAVCRELVRCGMGWSILPESLIPKDVHAFPAVFASGEPLHIPFVLLCQQYSEKMVAGQQLISLLRKSFSGEGLSWHNR